jgi:Bacteriophage probable baseplate hub protein
MAAENSPFRIARPTIVVAEKENPVLAQGLLSLLIVENINGLYRCEAQFGNWGNKNGTLGFLYFDRTLLDFGKTFQVKLGQDIIFDGRIMGMEAHFPEGGAPELTILAEDRFQDLRMTRRTRTFADVSDKDVMGQIANGHGLSADIDVNGPTYKVLAQVNQSDLAFLRERARSIDAELWMAGSTLHAQMHTKRIGQPVEIAYGRDLREFSVLADLAMQRTSVAVSGWDVASKAGLHYEATDSILNGELNGDNSGASILSSALGKRKESLVHTVPLSSQEAQSEAEAFFKVSARRFVTGHGVAEANSKLRVGNSVKLQGVGPLFSGKYYLSEVKHIFEGNCGIRTEFTAERPGLGQAQG